MPNKGAPHFGLACTKHFHEHRKLPPYRIESDRNEGSLTKRWQHISAGEHVKNRPVSGYGVDDKMSQALEYFRMAFKTKFTLGHCWDMIKNCPKWQESYNSMKKGGLEGSKKRANGDPNDDVNPGQISGGRAVRPRGHKSSAQDVKREAVQAQLEETLKTLIAGARRNPPPLGTWRNARTRRKP